MEHYPWWQTPHRTARRSVYLAAAMEYLVVEVLEQLAGNVARDNKKTRTIPVTSSSPSAMTRNCPNSSLVLPLPRVVSSPTS